MAQPAPQPRPDDYLVTNLPDLDPEDAAQLKQYAGHIALDPAKESNLFFWLVTNKSVQKNSKLIVWLNGGPGCSSADGYFLESGPLRFVNQKLTVNKGGWHEFANVVFLDQPVGTGLSYTTQQMRGTMGEITDNFVSFLKAFFAIFPERAQDDLYLAGESYAGTYIPYFAKGIVDYNDQRQKEDIEFNLKGVSIGNGWIDPLHQYTSYIPFITQHKLDTPDLLDDLTRQQDACLDAIRLQDIITQDTCEMMVQLILRHRMTGDDDNPKCPNQYDIRLTDDYPSCGLLWPYELPLMKDYLNRADVRLALHATGANEPWKECNGLVGSALRYDDSVPAVNLLPHLLTKMKVLLFSGEHDLICNHVGTEYLIGNLTWDGIQGFQDTRKVGWTIDGQAAGTWQEARNLSYVLLFNASHMVPYDVPLAALDMMNRFMGLDPKQQPFKSALDTDVADDAGSPGEKVDIAQPDDDDGSFWSGRSINGTAALLFVMMAVGLGIFVYLRRSRMQRKLGGGGDAQWFPLGEDGFSRGRSSRDIHTDELDELVVEGGIQDSDDDEDDEEERFGSRSGYRSH